MDVVKLVGQPISEAMAELAEVVLTHYKQREGESDTDFAHRLWLDMPRRKYDEMPVELQAWVDTYTKLDETIDFLKRYATPERLAELEADPANLAIIAAQIPRTAFWIIQASIRVSAEDQGKWMEVDIYPNLTGTAILEAWKEITGTDLMEGASKPTAENAGEAAATLAPFLHPAEDQETVELTQLVATDKVIFPTAKAFWKQSAIAQEGATGVSLSVDSKNTLITASISSLDGEQIKIAPEQQHLQAVIGQLIMENGAPITVTPAQLYRAFAGLPADAVVTDEQETSMIAALDPLLQTAAQLDFTQEIEKHTRIKRDPDYDYKKTRLTGSLVTGMKIEDGRATYNGKSLDVAYIIYAVPMYFAYSKAINQLATVDRSVLLGGGAAKKLPAGHPDQKPLQRRARNVVLRRYLMAQVERIKADKEKACRAALAKKQNPPATHMEHLTFDTIAAACDIDLTPKLKQQLRSDVKKILLDFSYNGYIRKAEEYREGRAIKGMKITV